MKNIKVIIPLALVLALGGYKLVLAKPAPKAKPKVHGHVYVLPKEFVVNLAHERLARFNVALVLDHDYIPGGEGGGHGAAAVEGFGADPQEALVRDIVVDEMSGLEAEELTTRRKREHLKEDIVEAIRSHTDVKVHHLLFTDMAVQ